MTRLPSTIIDGIPATGIDLTSLEAYHQDTSHVSHSMLSTFRRSPALFYGRYIAKTIPPKEGTDATLRGQLLHLSQSEPETWRDRFVIAPETAPDGAEWNKRLKKHREWWKEFEQLCEAEGKLNLTVAERDKILGMAAALVADPIAGPLLAAAKFREHPLFWTDHGTGLLCKCRVDAIILSPWCFLDIKSCEDPSPDAFNRQVDRLGYAHQQEHYKSGGTEVSAYWTGERMHTPDFRFLAVGSEEPHDVYVYRLELDWQMIGLEENRRDLRRLADCYAFDQWHPVGRGTIHELTPPTWRIKQWENA